MVRLVMIRNFETTYYRETDCVSSTLLVLMSFFFGRNSTGYEQHGIKYSFPHRLVEAKKKDSKFDSDL